MVNYEPSERLTLFEHLVAEAQHGDHQARDAIFLTYNVDLGYLEARLLGVCQATGARVTVVADASVWDPDTRAVRHAGRAYHCGLHDAGAAFHPKVMVLVGPKRAVAAVGSGNLTMGGWQYNAEIASVFTGDRDTMPSVFADLSGLLGSLVAEDRLDGLSADAVTRVKTRLDDLLASATIVETGHRAAASWDGPLIEALPHGPVEELLLSAPFHDPASRGVSALLKRLEPRRVKIAVQPGWTAADPRALEEALDGYRQVSGADIMVMQDAEGAGTSGPARYRHGKLIEWIELNGSRHAMTGSPNLSVAALLRDVASGGNHEVALISPLESSLFPGEHPIDIAQLPEPPPAAEEGRASTGKEAPLLSAVTRTSAGLRLHLARAAGHEADVQVSPRSDAPDDWVDCGVVPAGTTDLDIPADVVGGSRVRLRWAEAAGTVVFGKPVFVSDPNTVGHRRMPTKNHSRTQNVPQSEIFGDNTAWLDGLLGDLAEFARDVRDSKAPTMPGTGGEHQSSNEDRRPSAGEEPWLWLQDTAAQRHGWELAAYALALPRLAPEDTGAVGWVDKIGPDTSDLDEDTAEGRDAAADDAAVGTDEEPDPDHSNDPEKLKRARQRWLHKAVRLAPDVSVTSRLLILRLALGIWSAGNWAEGDDEPVELIGELLVHIEHADIPAELEVRVGSLVAVALAMMHDRVDLGAGAAGTLCYRRTVTKVAHLLLGADDDVIGRYCQGLRNEYGGPLGADAVREITDGITSNDPLASAEERMEAHGHDVTRLGPRHLLIEGDFTNAVPITLQAIAIGDDCDSVAVWARGRRGVWALTVWLKPDLVTVHTHRDVLRWRHRRLDGLGTPAVVYEKNRANGELGTQWDIVARPRHQPSETSRAVLEALGITDPEPPRSSE